MQKLLYKKNTTPDYVTHAVGFKPKFELVHHTVFLSLFPRLHLSQKEVWSGHEILSAGCHWDDLFVYVQSLW